jgi:hypothetical protein
LGVHRRQRRSSQLEPPRVVVKGQLPRLERELLPVTEPARDRRGEPACQRFVDIAEHDAGTPEEPLQPTPDQHVHTRRTHVHRDLANGLIGINEAQRTFSVSRLCDGGEILDGPAREIDV